MRPKALAYVADQTFDGRVIGDVAGESVRVDSDNAISVRLATPSACSRLLAYMTAICAPSLASAWQIRWPSPPLPPVTSATLPFRSIASIPS